MPVPLSGNFRTGLSEQLPAVRPLPLQGQTPTSPSPTSPSPTTPVPGTGGPAPLPNVPSLDPTGTGPGPRPLYPEPTTPVPKPPVTPGPSVPVNPAPGPSAPGSSTGTGTPPTSPTPATPQPPQLGNNTGYLGMDFMRQVTPNELVRQQLDALLSSNSQYMRNAELRGREQAGRRGLLNSSMAAGNAQRAALEAAMPIAQADAQAYRDANAANFQSLADIRRMRVAGDIENWLQSENFARDMNREMTMLPINSSVDMLRYIMERGLDDPAVYTPNVMSGFSNFFNLTLQNMFQNFFRPQTPTNPNPGGG